MLREVEDAAKSKKKKKSKAKKVAPQSDVTVNDTNAATTAAAADTSRFVELQNLSKLLLYIVVVIWRLMHPQPWMTSLSVTSRKDLRRKRRQPNLRLQAMTNS